MRGWQTLGRSTHDRRPRKKRSRAQRQPSEAPRQPADQPRTATTAPSGSASGSGWRSAPARSSTAATIHPEDYSYVYSDLKRIALLASGMFAALIVLSFIIG